MRTKNCILSLSLLVSALLPITSSAEQGAIRQIPASGIAIAKVWLNEHRQPGEAGVCAAFTNTSAVTAKRVQFLFSLIDKDGSVVYGQIHEARGEFAPGVLIQGESESTCDTAFLYLGGGKVSSQRGAGSMVASVSAVDYTDGTSWHAGPDIVGAAFSQPDADVRITKAFSWEPATNTQECVAYENSGTRTVRHIHFMFSHIADDGADVVDDPLDAYEPLSPHASHTMSCRGWNGSLTPVVGNAPGTASPRILVFGKTARLVAWISQIDYTDGASWHAPEPDKAAIASAAIPNAVDYAHATWWPAVPEIGGSVVQQSASGIELTRAYTWDPGAPNECVDFVNRSPKAVTRLRFLFSHVGTDGSAIGDEESLELHPRASFEAGTTQTGNCRTFLGTVTLPSQWNGGGTDSHVLFAGQLSMLQVRVDQVDFVDGTTWSASAKP